LADGLDAVDELYAGDQLWQLAVAVGDNVALFEPRVADLY
jgi:hypothetical protein